MTRKVETILSELYDNFSQVETDKTNEEILGLKKEIKEKDTLIHDLNEKIEVLEKWIQIHYPN